MCAIVPSLEPDAEALAWSQSAPRAELWGSVTQLTQVLLGEETLPFMPAAVLMPVLAEFFGSAVPASR
jgi:hypothetical protein